MGVDCGELSFGISGAHHLANRRLLILRGIDEDEIPTVLDVVVELSELPVFARYAHQAAVPGAEQCRHRHCREVDDGWDIRTERLEKLEQCDAKHSSDEAHCGTYKPIANEIQGLEIVTGIYVLFLQASLVLADDVQERVVDAKRTHIPGDSPSAFQGTSQVVKTVHQRSLPRSLAFMERTHRPLARGAR